MATAPIATAGRLRVLGGFAAFGAFWGSWGAALLPAALGGFAVVALLPGLASSTAGLSAALLVLGAASGAVDVAINAEGVRSEAAAGRPVLSLAHGTFSASVVVGSLATGGLRGPGAGALPAPGLAGALVGAVAVVGGVG